MINLAEITVFYINTTFQPELRKTIYYSFSILETFGLKFYEEKFIELIQRDDSIDSDSKRDNFIHMLEVELTNIINQHFIFLNNDYNPTLAELTEIANFLYIIQNLEDYDLISYRLNAEDTPRNIIVDLIDYLTLIEKYRIMEIVDHIEANFIEALKTFINEREDAAEKVDFKHLKHIRHFFAFIEKSDCLGLKLFNEGFNTVVTLEELLNASKLNIVNYIDKLMMTNRAQSALDCLSLLIICKDSYELPLLKFKQNTNLFTSNLDNITKLEASMLSILNDFNLFLTAKKQEEVLNAN